ncbi:MAG: orotate phosphoribosyltransferase [Acidobacteriota bacterium]
MSELSPMSESSTAEVRQRLLTLLAERSYQRRRVILASGRESDFYFDSKQTVLGAEGAWLTGRLFYRAIAELPEFEELDAVGGMELGSVPIASAIAVVSQLASLSGAGRTLDQLIVRRAPKQHGTQAAVEGSPQVPAGSKVAVVEDVVTTGGSSLRAVRRLREEGYVVESLITLIDRQEGGREAIEAEDLRLVSLFTKENFE